MSTPGHAVFVSVQRAAFHSALDVKAFMVHSGCYPLVTGSLPPAPCPLMLPTNKAIYTDASLYDWRDSKSFSLS